MHVGKEMLNFCQGHLSHGLEFHEDREGGQVYQMETVEELCCELLDLFPPLAGDVELMAKVWVGLMTGVNSDGLAHYKEGGGRVSLGLIPSVSTRAALVKHSTLGLLHLQPRPLEELISANQHVGDDLLLSG